MSKAEYIANVETIQEQNMRIRRLQTNPEILYDEDGNPVRFASILIVGKDFHKTYVKDLFRLLGVIGNSEIKILMYILENTTYQNFNLETANIFSGTYDEIQAATKCSRSTVAKVLKKLKACNAITKVATCRYRINPNLMSIGTELQQQRIMIQYNEDYIAEVQNENKQ